MYKPSGQGANLNSSVFADAKLGAVLLERPCGGTEVSIVFPKSGPEYHRTGDHTTESLLLSLPPYCSRGVIDRDFDPQPWSKA